MKRILYLFTLLLSFATVTVAQDNEGSQGEKIPERMRAYIQKRLDLNKSEAERFTPVFLNYFKELKQTNHQYKGDRLVLQQKIVDLRLRYRDQFKPIMGEKRSNEFFNHERDFMEEAKRIRQERIQNKNERLPGRRSGRLLP